jgi:hypothetical protein
MFLVMQMEQMGPIALEALFIDRLKSLAFPSGKTFLLSQF